MLVIHNSKKVKTMSNENRVAIIEEHLKIKLPKDYANFINNIGYYDGEYYEVYGFLESFENIDDYPCVIGATKKYREDHPLFTQTEIAIHFDDYLNTIVSIDSKDGKVYNTSFLEKKQIAKNFEEWFRDLLRLENKIIQEEQNL